MNRLIFQYLYIILIISALYPENESIKTLNKEKEKIQKEIELRDKEIESLNKELELIRKKITNTTNSLNTTTQQAIKGQKDLIKIEQDISKNKNLLKSIENDISSINVNISKQNINILKQKNKIDSIDKIIRNIESSFKERTKKAYRLGTKSNLSWEEKKYLRELNKYVDQSDINKEEKYLAQLLILDKNKIELENNLKELEIALISKKKLFNFKKEATKDLISSKKTKNEILVQLKAEKKALEKKLSKKKKEEKIKKEQIKSTQQLISKLLQNKEKNKKRTEELIKIRQKQNKQISGNFSKMKGKIPWPADGNITSKFGNQINPELNTITENIGIEIKCINNETIASVTDGIVSLISYIPIHGNIIIIDHGEGYSTVYANLDKIFVYENDYVSSGTAIGTVSKEGKRKQLLHFEIWHKDKKLNPESWLIKK